MRLHRREVVVERRWRSLAVGNLEVGCWERFDELMRLHRCLLEVSEVAEHCNGGK